nr:3,2-trans-enoyl-coa isomerase [Quercus suber]
MAQPKPYPNNEVLFEVRGKIAIITINRPKRLNAVTQNHYMHLARLLNYVATRDDIFITVLTAKGRFFSAGADVTASTDVVEGRDDYQRWLQDFVPNNLHNTQAFYAHPKILVTALNGPAVGLSAALTAHSDFVYAAPHTYLLTPFSSLGLVTEGNASFAFVQRLGISKANEALIMSKKITCAELVQTGFVNKVFEVQPGEDEKFLEMVFQEIQERLGDHLVSDSMTKIKALIRRPERQVQDAQGVAEVLGGLDRFANGIPQKEFSLIASGKKKHKL